MSLRISCCVPFCKRTKRKEEGYSEWICQKHWSLVPAGRRRAYRRIRRQLRQRHEHWNARADRIWSRLKKVAIERSMGL